MVNGNPPSGAIRCKRRAVGMSQERLAQLAGCSTSTVKIVEHGYACSEPMLERLARALGCDPDDLRDPAQGSLAPPEVDVSEDALRGLVADDR